MGLAARHRGLLLAVLVAAAAIAWQYERHREEIEHFNRFDLPAFDPWVYVAMAEQPAVFAVAPWSYRILTPWVVHALPTRPLRGYRILLITGFAAAGALFFLYLRRLGFGELPSLLAVAVLELSGPVAECMRLLVVAEPLSILLEVAFVLALEAGAGLAVLTLLGALLAYSKEIWVFLLPLVFMAYRVRGPARGLGATAIVALPAFFISRVLRDWWVPHIHPPTPPLDLALVGLALDQLRSTWADTLPPALLAGVTPLALLGALRAKARPYLLRYGYLAAATYALAFGAWIYIPSATASPLFGPNVRRLLLYALPFLLPLCLYALDRVWPHASPPAAPALRTPRAVTRAAALGVALCLVFPFAALDRYRRVPLHSYRDGQLVLTICRETLRAARRLEAGREVSWDLEQPAFLRGEDDPRVMARMRWYLRDGWGPEPHLGSGPVAMAGATSTLLLPSFDPASRSVELALFAVSGERLAVEVNGARVGEVVVAPGLGDYAVRVPASVLFRGDNHVTLRRAGSGPAPRLHRFGIRPSA